MLVSRGLPVTSPAPLLPSAAAGLDAPAMSAAAAVAEDVDGFLVPGLAGRPPPDPRPAAAAALGLGRVPSNATCTNC